jgi:hypothetical protein
MKLEKYKHKVELEGNPNAQLKRKKSKYCNEDEKKL